LSPTKPWHGLLGLSVLKNWAIGIDPKKQRLTFWKEGRLSSGQVRQWFQDTVGEHSGIAPKLTTLPLHYNERVECFWTQASLDGVEEQFCLDTGTTGILITEQLARQITPTGVPAPTSPTLKVLHADEGTFQIRASIQRSLALGEFVVEAPLIDTVLGGKENTLGIGAFAGSKILINFPYGICHVPAGRRKLI